MKHVQATNPFMASDPWPGASPRVRRALAQMNLETDSIHRVKAGISTLKLKAVVPVFDKDAIAHIGIPSKKVAIYFRGYGDRDRIEVKREAWLKKGWKMLAVAPTAIDGMTDEAMVNHLKAAIAEVGK